MRELFGTDGVRGLAGVYPLDSDGCQRIGKAVGTLFAGPDGKVIIGRDTRESSAKIAEDLASGLMAEGIDVVKVGVITTPGLAYLTREGSFAAGLMVTASHNPYQYNGVKVFDHQGEKLPDETEAKLNSLIEDGVGELDTGNFTEDLNLIRDYEDFLVGSGDGLRLSGMRVAIDTANGAASGLAERVFRRLGAEVTTLYDKPDGKNINDGCGATDTKVLQQCVLKNHLDMGIALDGDADRLIMVDELGREVKGDYLLYILAVTGHHTVVVATVMSNLGFELSLQKRGIKLERTQVGDRYVLERLQQTGYKLGGEQAGHIILYDLLKTGDGLLAAVQTLRALNSSDKTLAQWCDEVKLLPQALVNISLSDKSLLEHPSVKTFIDEQSKQLGDSGRLLIRSSGTEPLARVMVEAPNAETKAQKIAANLQELLNSLGIVNTPEEYPTTFTESKALDSKVFNEADANIFKQLADKGYEVHLGLTQQLADEISKMCLQPSIKEYCPNDSAKRFTNSEAAKEWMSKGRAVYLLMRREKNGQFILAGYGWAGKATSPHVPGGESTFALRISERSQGQGLATPFARTIVAATTVLFGAKNMWLETWASNTGAVHVYNKLGFIDVDQEPGKRPTNTNNEVEDIRLYMSLPNDLL